jgi:hypothetical protein
MSLVPPEILCLLASAFLTKSFNRTPPLWERLLAGLRYYDTPYKSDVERVLAAAVAQDVAPVRWAVEAATMQLHYTTNHDARTLSLAPTTSPLLLVRLPPTPVPRSSRPAATRRSRSWRATPSTRAAGSSRTRTSPSSTCRGAT